MPNNSVQQLCLKCGMCCNGVIFADVQLQAGDDLAQLKTLGLPLSIPRSGSRVLRLRQPCAAFDGCRCNIYAQRPAYCRQFECALLKKVGAGELETSSALRVISTARRRAERVRSLLRELGDTEETLALSKRFQRMTRRFQSGVADNHLTGVFGQLTVAMHDLNVLLSDAFYPGQA